MTILNIFLGTMIIMALGFAVIYCRDLYINRKKENLTDRTFIPLSAVGYISSFFDTLGIGCFATTTAMLKIFKLTDDRRMPGTLNVGCTIPVIIEALLFTNVIKVDLTTLIPMVAAAAAGALIGAGIVAKLNEVVVQIGMGVALLIVMTLMFMSQIGLTPSGGTATGLTGTALIIGIAGNFILGALMTLGIGLYAPCLALVYSLGMSPQVAFPIMMGSCAFLMIIASVKFIKEDAYDRKASMPRTLFGICGVFTAFYVVKTLPLNTLMWIVIGVIACTSIMMFRSARENIVNREKKTSALNI